MDCYYDMTAFSGPFVYGKLLILGVLLFLAYPNICYEPHHSFIENHIYKNFSEVGFQEVIKNMVFDMF
jgi:hypothetical protein